MPTVVGNKFQRKQAEVRNEAASPGTGTYHSTMGVLSEVYDTEKLQAIQVSGSLARKLENAPGLLFAKVTLRSGRWYVLPFKEPEDLIYLIYGNSFLLEGRDVKITWQGMSIDSGVIEMARSWATPHFNILETTAIFDIGNII